MYDYLKNKTKSKDETGYQGHIPINQLKIKGISGKLIKNINKQSIIGFKVNGILFQALVVVVNKLSIDLLLGTDFLIKHKVILDFAKQYCQLNNTKESTSIEFSQDTYPWTLVNNVCSIGSDQNNSDDKQWQNRMHEVREYLRKNVKNNNTSVQTKIINLFNKHRNNFSTNPGKMKDVQAKLELEPGSKVDNKSYPIPYSKKIKVKQKLDELMQAGIIEESTSSYTNPLVVITKRDGNIRLCLDARNLNKHLKKDQTCPEEIDSILQRFHGKKFFTVFDLSAGYWQLELEPHSRQYTAFIVGGRNYQFTRLPFGLCNSVAKFIRCLNHVLGPEIGSLITLYVDDMIIASETLEEHLWKLDKILNKIAEIGITLSIEKSQFLAEKVKFLGFIMDNNGIIPDPDKVQSILNFPSPKNRKQLQSFLGMCNYFRKFHNNYSGLTGQLSHVLSVKNKWQWTAKENNVFNEIKNKFLNCIMLRHPDFNKPFYITCDASALSIGAYLYQLNENDPDDQQVISFTSRILSSAERNYSTTEQEMLAIVNALNKFRTYVLGHKTIVKSDHKAISFFKNCRLGHGRLTRWILALQEYDLEWNYLPGKENQVVDALSRVEGDVNNTENDVFRVLCAIREKIELENIIRDIGPKQRLDERLNNIIVKLEQDPSHQTLSNFYNIHDGILFGKYRTDEMDWKVCLSSEMEEPFILDYHQRFGHMGIDKTYHLIKQHAIFPNVYRKVRQIVTKCDICQKCKAPNYRLEGEPQNIRIGNKLNQVYVDLCGPLPRGMDNCNYVFILVDGFTKYVRLFPIVRADLKTCARLIQERYIPEVGKPQAIISDHGTQFKGNPWKVAMEGMGIKTFKTAVYNPQANLSERVLREVGRILRVYCYKQHRKWPRFIRFVEHCLNVNVHESTGFSPHELMFGRKPPYEIQEILNYPNNQIPNINDLHAKAKANIQRHQQKRLRVMKKLITKPIRHEPGDLVLYRNHALASGPAGIAKKLQLRWIGPVEVLDKNNRNDYLLAPLQLGNAPIWRNCREIKKYYR
jgi:hypothetical protein